MILENKNNKLKFVFTFQLHQPAYASCLFFELYQSDQPYIQIFYKKSLKMRNVRPLDISGCGKKCSLIKFHELYQHILPTQNFDKECELRDGEVLPSSGNPENAPY